jgi:hypothetical protein
MHRSDDNHRELKSVESQHNELVPEEFADGPYGAATHPDKLGKSSPWTSAQHAAPQFTYEMREFHEGIARQMPGSHPTHDEPET